MDYRVILFHKQSTSARLRFLRFSDDGVFGLGPVPSRCVVHEGSIQGPAVHPAQVLRRLEDVYGFDADRLASQSEYRYWLEAVGSNLAILLVQLLDMDPPFAQAERIGASFIDLTQARGLPTVQLELLRGAYELILGG